MKRFYLHLKSMEMKEQEMKDVTQKYEEIEKVVKNLKSYSRITEQVLTQLSKDLEEIDKEMNKKEKVFIDAVKLKLNGINISLYYYIFIQ